MIGSGFVRRKMPAMVFVCPYNPEHVFYSYSQFAECPGCNCDPVYSDLTFGCRLVELYAHTAYLNNLHRDKEETVK
jgi:hypothetical protein